VVQRTLGSRHYRVCRSRIFRLVEILAGSRQIGLAELRRSEIGATSEKSEPLKVTPVRSAPRAGRPLRGGRVGSRWPPFAKEFPRSYAGDRSAPRIVQRSRFADFNTVRMRPPIDWFCAFVGLSKFAPARSRLGRRVKRRSSSCHARLRENSAPSSRGRTPSVRAKQFAALQGLGGTFR